MTWSITSAANGWSRRGSGSSASRSSQVVAGRREDLEERVALDARSWSGRSRKLTDRVAAGLEPSPAAVVDQADLAGPAR